MANKTAVSAPAILISSATVSFISSLILGVAIVSSRGCLKTPIRRLMFGLSFCDFLQSLALIVGPFSTPGSEISPLFRGNQTTCSIQGFILELGGHGTLMYTCALTYYYFCKLRRNMSDETFYTRIERKVHIIIVIICLSIGILGAAAQSLSTFPPGIFCAIAPPQDDPERECQKHPELYTEDECKKEATKVTIFKILSVTYFLLMSFCLICIIKNSFSILRDLIKRDKEFGATRRLNNANDLSRNTRSNEDAPQEAMRDAMDSEHDVCAEEGEVSEEIRSSQDERRLSIRKTMTRQAILYVAVFFFIHTPFVLYLIALNIDGTNPYTVLFTILAIMYPLGGLLNMYVYTRPSVWVLRNRDGPLSWPRAFVLVIKAGGAVPEAQLTQDASEIHNAQPDPLRRPQTRSSSASNLGNFEMISALPSRLTPSINYDDILLSSVGAPFLSENSSGPGKRQYYDVKEPQ